MTVRLSTLALFLLAGHATAQSKPATPPALWAITAADLKRDMFVLGGDAMRGREAGMYATGWIIGMAAQRPDVVPGFRLER